VPEERPLGLEAGVIVSKVRFLIAPSSANTIVDGSGLEVFAYAFIAALNTAVSALAGPPQFPGIPRKA
jgi:hypothetical protein